VDEPFRLFRWKPKQGNVDGQLYTCARPGRSHGRDIKQIPDIWVDAWVHGMPTCEKLFIVSLLGSKDDGMSEFSFYSFRSDLESPDTDQRPTFQQWLDARHGSGRFQVLEFPTVDLKPLHPETLSKVISTIRDILLDGRTVVLMDSGGIGRTGRVCHSLGFVQVSDAYS
jgi:hypothetical protein